MNKELTIKERIEARLDELINKYDYTALDKNVEKFLRENADKFKFFPFIGPLFETSLALEYDKDSGEFLDIDIVYENDKIVLNLFKVIGIGKDGIETEIEDISFEEMIEEINKFHEKKS